MTTSVGGGVSRPVGNTSHLSVHGFRKSDGYTRCIICGNTREYSGFQLVQQGQAGFCRNLEARKEQREQAWQIDGWAETVSKVSLPDLALEVNLLSHDQTAQLAKTMDSFILSPLSFSPLK